MKILSLREILSLPLYVIVVVLYVASAFVGLLADKIAGQANVMRLFDWRIP